jgi:alpha-mannosidase
MLKHRKLSIGRVEQFARRLQKCVYQNPYPLQITYLPSSEPIPFIEVKKRKFEAISLGTNWGSQFDCAWFNIRGKVPQEYRGKNLVALIDLGGEACLFSKTGKPLQGLTPKFEDRHGGFLGPKKEIKLFESAKGNEPIDLWLDVGANHLQGRQRKCEITQAEMCEFDPLAYKLFHEYRFLEMFLKALPDESRQGQLILRALNDVCNLVTEFSNAELAQARERLS